MRIGLGLSVSGSSAPPAYPEMLTVQQQAFDSGWILTGGAVTDGKGRPGIASGVDFLEVIVTVEVGATYQLTWAQESAGDASPGLAGGVPGNYNVYGTVAASAGTFQVTVTDPTLRLIFFPQVNGTTSAVLDNASLKRIA